MPMDALARALALKFIKGKANLVDGKVPADELPSYVSDIVEVQTYQDLPNPGQLNVIYVVKTPTVTTYRWTGSTYITTDEKSQYYSVKVDSSNITTMSDLRTFINNINASGLHCFFDFSDYIANAYICTVLLFTQSNTNYCLVFDVINGRTFINYNGYQDNELVQDYVNINEDNLIRAIKITDSNTTLGDINNILSGVNIVSHHVMFDVSVLNTGAYLCTILTDGSTSFKVMDIVSQKVNSVVYNANTTLLSVLQGMSEIVDTGSDQTITGVKTFSNDIKLESNGFSSPKLIMKNNYGTNSIYSDGTNGIFVGTHLCPAIFSGYNLGRDTRFWSDLYLKGSLKDGTNSVSVADISNGLFNVINASDIVNNTLTQEQFDLITNGKITRIVGNLFGLSNPIIYSPYKSTTSTRGTIVGQAGVRNFDVSTIVINNNSLVMSKAYTYLSLYSDNGTVLLMNKTIPAYPTTNTSPQVLTIGANGGNLSWSDDGLFNVINASDIVNNTLTQTQLTLLANTKLTRIVGDITISYYQFHDLILSMCAEQGSLKIGHYEGNFGPYNQYAEGTYQINQNGVISLMSDTSKFIRLRNIAQINGKDIPNYPTATTKQYKFVQKVGGNLDYLPDYAQPYATNSTTQIEYETINNISISSDTTFTLATAPNNTYPEYKANIENTSSSAIVLTFTGVNKINTNDSNITIVNNTLTLPGNTTIEVNIFNGNLLAYNWEA